jgi:hypothetical protein
MRRFLLIVLAVFVLAPLAMAEEEILAVRPMSGKADVYAYSHVLNAEDKLTDGPRGRAFKLASDTMLLWVDLVPGGRFAHSTVYIFISPRGTRVQRGLWWPVLNGRTILYGKHNPVAITSPVEVTSPNAPNPIEVFAYPEELTAQDKLTDGSKGRAFPLWSKTMLLWVDLLPGARFEHDTVYILIGANGIVRAIDGKWWPELNGKRILYGNRGTYAWTSPFAL